jgi:hypothetical protein
MTIQNTKNPHIRLRAEFCKSLGSPRLWRNGTSAAVVESMTAAHGPGPLTSNTRERCPQPIKVIVLLLGLEDSGAQLARIWLYSSRRKLFGLIKQWTLPPCLVGEGAHDCQFSPHASLEKEKLESSLWEIITDLTTSKKPTSELKLTALLEKSFCQTAWDKSRRLAHQERLVTLLCLAPPTQVNRIWLSCLKRSL